VYSQVELHRQQELVEKLLFLVLVRRVEEFGDDLVFRQREVDPSGIRQDCDQIRNLLLDTGMRLIRKFIRVINQFRV